MAFISGPDGDLKTVFFLKLGFSTNSLGIICLIGDIALMDNLAITRLYGNHHQFKQLLMVKIGKVLLVELTIQQL